MKIRKGILSILIISLASIILSMVATKVNAAVADPSLYLGIEEYRQGTPAYGYEVLDKIMWKISSYESKNKTNPDQSRTFYCIKGGDGFGSVDDVTGKYVGLNTVQEYKFYFDLKDRDSIKGNYSNAIPSGANYNSLIWVLEHCYVPGLSTSQSYRKELIEEAIKGTDLSANINISDSEIDVAQQLAIWYFTNDGDSDYQITDESFELAVKAKNEDANYVDISEKFGRAGEDRNDLAVAIFNYLVRGGIANSTKVPIKIDTKNLISLTSTNAGIKLENGNYILGPYTLTGKSNVEYKLSSTLKNGESPVAYKIVNEVGTEISLEEVLGGQFYISVSKDAYVSGLQFEVTATTYETTLTYWSVQNAPETDQPVVEITRNKKESKANIVTPNIPEEKLFDLALRKFITAKTTGETKTQITNRVPDVTPTNLATLNKGKWTVEKPHIKTPVEVNVGDIVEYTIRIYNEGELDGYALEITDHLPEGLEYIDSALNRENGWVPSSDKKTITTNKLSKTLLKAFEGGEISFADVKIECKVVASVTSSDQILKNVAQITDHIDINGNKTDRDSQPNNLTQDQIKNYNPGTSTLGFRLPR